MSEICITLSGFFETQDSSSRLIYSRNNEPTDTWMSLGMDHLNGIDICLTDEIIARSTCLVLRSP